MLIPVLLICAIVSFGLNAAGVVTRLNLDALGKAFLTGAALAYVWP